MADEQQDPQAIPQAPTKGRIVSDDALYMSQISLYRNSLAFGGQRNPSETWATMMYNLPQAMLLYRELEDKDEDVFNSLNTLRLKVLERDHSIEPGDESQQALDVKDFVEDQLAVTPNFHAVLDCILDAPGYGFSVQEMIFDASAGQASLIGINDCPQELFLFNDRYKPQVGPLQFLSQPWASNGDLVPEEKFIVFSYRMRGRNRMGRPLLKSVFWPSWFKRNMQRLWVQFAEKGPGTAVVRYNDPDNAAEKQQAAEIAQALVDRTAIAVPTSFQFEPELLKIARAQDPGVYEKYFMAMQYSIARAILGETLTSFGNEGGKGSNAQGQTHADTLDSRVVELCRAVAAVINYQLVRPLVLWNFGPDAPMPKWGFNVGQEEDLANRLLVDSGLQRMGKQFTAGYVSGRYDVELVKGENPDAIMVPNVNAPQVMGQDRTTSTFGEAEQEAEDELGQFDKLFADLAGKSTKLMKERVGEVVREVRPSVVK